MIYLIALWLFVILMIVRFGKRSEISGRKVDFSMLKEPKKYHNSEADWGKK